MTTTLILVRHGETDWNLQGKLQGATDTALNETGLGQAEALAQALVRERFDAMVSSPLQRAYRTALAIAEAAGMDEAAIVVDPLFAERAYGQAEGMTIEERDKAFPDMVWPGSETTPELNARVASALEWLLERYAGQTVCVVTHGGWIRGAMRVIAGARSPQARLQIPNTSCTYISHDGDRWQIGDTALVGHLAQ